MKRKISGVLLALMMCLTLVPASPAAAAADHHVASSTRSADREPKCYGWNPFTRCNYQKLFRTVYWGTNPANPSDVKAALLLVMTPVQNAHNNGSLNATMANVYHNLNTVNRSNKERVSRCVYSNLLAFMRYEGKNKVLTQNVSDTFGAAKRVAAAGGPWSGALKKYMSTATKLTKVAGKITASRNAQAYMSAAMMCR